MIFFSVSLIMSDSNSNESVNLPMLMAAVGMIVAIIMLVLCVCWRVHKVVHEGLPLLLSMD